MQHMRCTHIRQHWQFAASLRNAFDEDAREPSDGRIPDDYPLEGRSIFGEIGYHF
jgi:iron complex outermembrane receptor protein